MSDEISNPGLGAQLDDRGRLRHLLSISGLSRELLTRILDDADALVEGDALGRQAPPLLSGRTVVNLFFEASTRTRTSFELAARRLGAEVVNFHTGSSSTVKGETLVDTVHTIEAMGGEIFVLRHSEEGVSEYVAANVHPGVHVVNGGDGAREHPTQALLDCLTIRRYHPDFSNLSVAIVGDIRHSRVAGSDLHAFRALGIEDLRIAGPSSLLPEAGEYAGVRICHSLEEAVADAHVVMTLRIQNERMGQADIPPTAADYFSQWGLTEARLSGAHPDYIVMHPGPMNRGVEIDGALADGPRSVILEQVRNGVAVRMAVMAMIIRNADQSAESSGDLHLG